MNMTISLAGSEVKAEYSGANAWLRNDGTDVIYAAAKPGITAGADGVVAIPAGQSAPVYGANGAVWLTGTGSVQLIGSDYSTNPFKMSAQAGGSGADDVARAAISAHSGNAEIHVTLSDKAAWNAKAETSDIPTKISELTNDSGFITSPDGGNADTVDGKHSSDFMQNLGTLTTGSLLDYVLTMTNSGYLLVRNGVTDTPVSGQFFFVDVRRDASGSYAITATRFNAGGVYTNRYNVTMAKWYGWANVADGGNAASVGGKTITVTDVDPGAGSALGTGEIVFVTEVT